MDNRERIAALSAFLDCGISSAEKLNAKMTFKVFSHKDILVHQGDMNNQIWLILDGNAQLQAIGYEGQITLLTAQGPGEIFGAYPTEAISNVDIKIYGTLTALQISSLDLKNLLDEHPGLGKGLSKIFGNQFNAIVDRLAMHVTLTAKGRVYKELLRMSGNEDEITPYPVITAIALNAQTTRETASRAISALQRRGIIDRHDDRMQIISHNMIEELIF